MRSFQILSITAVLILTMSSFFAPRYSANSQTKQNESIRSTIYGRVVYEDTDRPVGSVRVMLRSATSFGPEQLIGTTNRRGEFRIGGVPAGRYFIGVDSSGFVATDSFINLDEIMQTRFYVDEMREYFEVVEVDGKTNKRVLVRARRGAVISGNVSYTNGEPAVDHPVTVLRRRGNHYSMFWTNVSTMQAALLTDDRGMFRIMGLPAGEYLVGATPMIEHGELVKDESLEANMIGSSLAMTFHPSTVRATQATIIRVRAGEERAGVDITIGDGERYKLSGVVRGRDDKRPVANASVRLVRKETNEMVSRAVFWPYSVGMPGVKTDELGRWRLTQVPDGTYIIFVQPPSGYNELPPEARRYSAQQQEIEVSGVDVSNVVIELVDDVTVSGTVTAESGPIPRNIFIVLEREGMNQGVAASAVVERGKFTIRNVPAGQMYFFINLEEDTENFYIKSITWKGKDLLRELLDVGVQTKIEGVEIVLSRLVAHFAIRVRNARGEPVRDISVTLVPLDPARWTRPETQLFGTTDLNGRCTIIGGPGEYLVFIMPPGVQSSTLQKNEIEEHAATAQRVSLKQGERRTFDLLMRPIE
ncbi:MAG TPA: carboxypeptidase-like regulatory domain-containing protein [Pyrinomonadaceae bacterium]|nr:carboxypeptidase-like regulatory domain-containing protein [Pyrinomonadaceae bacterium]